MTTKVITDKLIEAFECNCITFNELAILYDDKRRITEDTIGVIKDAIVSVDVCVDAINNASITYKKSVDTVSFKTVIMKRSGVENTAAEAALKAAIADVLGI